MDVDTVLVFERGVGALLRRDASAASAKCHRGFGHPAGSKAVEEVGLACNLAVVHVCVSEFADVDLDGGQWLE
jgi:hypothetical protein